MVTWKDMKKITTITFMVMLLAISPLFTKSIKVSAAISTPPQETKASCDAGIDADGNGKSGTQDLACQAIYASIVESSTPPQETKASCDAGIDADGNGKSGTQDLACQAIYASIVESSTPPQETKASCDAGIDADGDGKTGSQDSDCAQFATTTPVVSSTPAPSTPPHFSAGSTSGGGSSSFGLSSGTPVSTVITSTSTDPASCSLSFLTYMKKGAKGGEVSKLQKYLGVMQTGFFGPLTNTAVKAFQLKYADSVLAPWGLKLPTGYFYKTTQRQMNLLMCSTLNIPMPVLN
jgi:hypothetical protein